MLHLVAALGREITLPTPDPSRTDRCPWQHCIGSFFGVCRVDSFGDLCAKSKQERENVTE